MQRGLSVLICLALSLISGPAMADAPQPTWQSEAASAKKLIEESPDNAAKGFIKAMQLMQTQSKVSSNDPAVRQMILFDIPDTYMKLKHNSDRANLVEVQFETMKKVFGPHSAFAYLALIDMQAAKKSFEVGSGFAMTKQMTAEEKAEFAELSQIKSKHQQEEIDKTMAKISRQLNAIKSKQN